jgi:hypothetical protein
MGTSAPTDTDETIGLMIPCTDSVSAVLVIVGKTGTMYVENAQMICFLLTTNLCLAIKGNKKI